MRASQKQNERFENRINENRFHPLSEKKRGCLILLRQPRFFYKKVNR